MIPNKIKQNSGFVIFYAVFITTVVLIVGVSLMNIMTKQLVLSSISRNAKISYYAALSGRNCAEFWKTVQQANGNNPTYFGGKLFDDTWASDPTPSTITCFNNGFVDLPSDQTIVTDLGGGIFETSFHFDLILNTNQKACAKVYIYLNKNKIDECAADQLLITSEGYNSTCAEIGNNPRNVRSIYRDKEVCPD